mmetsp:Transcript_118154/g.312290  ORF Transcript_118154/g.312290 Transcript_118154/m.312290 type:complete len:247 (+) Transcript_118154:163-903(+)
MLHAELPHTPDAVVVDELGMLFLRDGLDLPFVPLLAPLVLQQVVAVGRPAPVHRDGGRLVQARAWGRLGVRVRVDVDLANPEAHVPLEAHARAVRLPVEDHLAHTRPRHGEALDAPQLLWRQLVQLGLHDQHRLGGLGVRLEGLAGPLDGQARGGHGPYLWAAAEPRPREVDADGAAPHRERHDGHAQGLQHLLVEVGMAQTVAQPLELLPCHRLPAVQPLDPLHKGPAEDEAAEALPVALVVPQE